MKHIRGNTYYHDSVVCQGGYCIDSDWLIIDTGNDDSSAKKSIRDLGDIEVKYVFNTHSHADHCGGNQFFQKRYNAHTFAPDLESHFITAPILEPVYLYGAAPPHEMKNKFLFAKPSRVDQVLTSERELSVIFEDAMHTFKLISLKGHSPNMMGIITPDNIAFLGDALMGEKFLEKHALIFTFNVQDHMASIERLRDIQAEGYVLAHGGYYDRIDALIDQNLTSITKASEMVYDACTKAPITFDGLHGVLAEQLQLNEMLSTNMLNRSVIKAHVQHLVDQDQLIFQVEKGQVLILQK